MAIHILRDYLTQNIATVSKQWIPGYLLAIFLRRILGYTYVGDTNYPINSVGTLLISTADSTPTVAPTFAAGTRAGINQGLGREFYVWIPPTVRTVQLADIGRLMVLKSTANPTYNSGVYLITGLENQSLSVSNTSGNSISPITITTSVTNNLTTGQTVTISGVTGNTAANGTWTITVLNGTQFTINATGNGTYGGGGTVSTNSYIIDYRTMGEAPPQEAYDSMNWYIYAADSAAPISGSQNSTYASGSYGGNGNSTTPRIIMQSPHSLGWQVRLCHETYADYSLNSNGSGNYGNVAAITAIPGFGGNSAGDFAVGGPHLHTALFYNVNNVGRPDTYLGCTPGFGDDHAVNRGIFTQQHRITMVGDDTGQGVVLTARKVTSVSVEPREWICVFGLPENEPLPLPVNNAARLFCWGSGLSTGGSGSGSFLNNITWSAGTCNFFVPIPGQGISQSTGRIPCSMVPAVWTYAVGNGQQGSPMFDGSAADGSWANTTELFTVDILNGSVSVWAAANSGGTGVTPTSLPFQLEPRIIGTFPHVRSGRTNFGDFSVTTDGYHAWQHLRRGMYVTWNGPQVIP